MGKYLHKFETSTEFSAAYNGEDYLEPWVSYTEEGGGVAKYNKTEYEKLLSTPLTFEIQSDGIIKWTASNSSYTSTIEYSLNGGEWASITSTTGGTEISVSSGDTVQFRGDNARYTSGTSNTFSGSTCQFKAYGNIMSLIDSDGYANLTTLSSAYTFSNLMNYCTGLTDAGNLILPATTLATGCYSYMFYGCTSLTIVPELPATILGEECYSNMFNGCTSLTTAPNLPATTLAYNCYGQMFAGCTSLTAAPELPATTLVNQCYYRMFNGCTSLTSAPELPATTLATSCYMNMFGGCTSLTTAPELPVMTLASQCYSSMFKGCTSLTTTPELPATTLAVSCYYEMFRGCTNLTIAPELPATALSWLGYCYMFSGCTNLNYIKCLATDISETSCTNKWVSGVASSGTFVKNPSMSSWTTGNNGIPSNWTVQDAS